MRGIFIPRWVGFILFQTWTFSMQSESTKTVKLYMQCWFIAFFPRAFLWTNEQDNPPKSLENQYTHIVIKRWAMWEYEKLGQQRVGQQNIRSWFTVPYLRFYINYNKFAWQRKYFSPLFIIVCTCLPSMHFLFALFIEVKKKNMPHAWKFHCIFQCNCCK